MSVRVGDAFAPLAEALRILLVSQMYPGPSDPDLGVFVAQMERALRERGHDVELAVLDRRGGGKRRYARARATRPRRAVSRTSCTRTSSSRPD